MQPARRWPCGCRARASCIPPPGCRCPAGRSPNRTATRAATSLPRVRVCGSTCSRTSRRVKSCNARSLLRQPRSFEPIGSLLILLDAAELAAFDHVDVSQLHVDWNPAFRTMTREANPDERPIAVGLDLKRLHLQVGIGLDPSPNLPPHRLDSPVSRGVGGAGGVHVHAVGM